MPTSILTEEATLATELKVETNIVSPLDKIVSKHIDINMKEIRANENSSTEYNYTVIDNITGVEQNMAGHFTVGQESFTTKPTLALSINDIMGGLEAMNSPQANKMLKVMVEAKAMHFDGASDEAIQAHYDANGVRRSDGVSKGFKATLSRNSVKSYAAIVKIHPLQ